MRTLAAFLTGIALTLAACAIFGYIGIVRGLLPVNADATPGTLERWAARTALVAGVERHMQRGKNPAKGNEAILRGIHLYMADCQVCHGGGDGSQDAIARGFYQKSPQFAKDGVEDVPYDYTAWVIRHGIRFTAMPAFGATLSSEQINDIALFLGRMNSLTRNQRFAWSGAPLQSNLAALYRVIGGFRRCRYWPSPHSSPLGYVDDTRGTSDGRFIIEHVYDLNRRVAELTAVTFDVSRHRYLGLAISDGGTSSIQTAAESGGTVWQWMRSGQVVTTTQAKANGTYVFTGSNGSSGVCAAALP